MTTRVTEGQVSDWVGNHGYGDKREDWMLTTLTEIANGDYIAEELKDDVIDYSE